MSHFMACTLFCGRDPNEFLFVVVGAGGPFKRGLAPNL